MTFEDCVEKLGDSDIWSIPRVLSPFVLEDFTENMKKSPSSHKELAAETAGLVAVGAHEGIRMHLRDAAKEGSQTLPSNAYGEWLDHGGDAFEGYIYSFFSKMYFSGAALHVKEVASRRWGEGSIAYRFADWVDKKADYLSAGLGCLVVILGETVGSRWDGQGTISPCWSDYSDIPAGLLGSFGNLGIRLGARYLVNRK